MLHLLRGGVILLCTLLQHVAHLLGISIAVVHDTGGHLIVSARSPCLLCIVKTVSLCRRLQHDSSLLYFLCYRCLLSLSPRDIVTLQNVAAQQ